MTNSQRLTIRASEIRQRLNTISGLEGDALTDEVRAEETALQTEYRDTETKLRAAIASDPDPVETRHAELAGGPRASRAHRDGGLRGGLHGRAGEARDHGRDPGATAALRARSSRHSARDAGDARRDGGSRQRRPESGHADPVRVSAVGRRVPGDRHADRRSRRGRVSRADEGTGRSHAGRERRRGRDHRDVLGGRARPVSHPGRVLLLAGGPGLGSWAWTSRCG